MRMRHAGGGLTGEQRPPFRTEHSTRFISETEGASPSHELRSAVCFGC